MAGRSRTPRNAPRTRCRPARVESREAARRWAEKTVARCCAWCLREVGENEPVIGLFTSFRGKRRGRPRSGWISVSMGDRLIHGRVAPLGSPASLEGAEIGFLVCSQSCAAELTQAARDDELQSIKH